MEGIGEDLDDAIFRALDPDKEGRYPSVHSFARDAKPALGNPKQGVKKLGAIVSEAIGANTDDAPFTEDLDEEERALESEEEQAAYPLNGRWARHKEKQAARPGSEAVAHSTSVLFCSRRYIRRRIQRRRPYQKSLFARAAHLGAIGVRAHQLGRLFQFQLVARVGTTCTVGMRF